MNFTFLYLISELISEWTVRPNFKSPHNPIVKLSNLFFSQDIVNKSVKVCVGWLCPPSPAFIIGTSDFKDATSGAPSFGCLIAIISLYPPTIFTVSATLSPFDAELDDASENPITFPPSSIIAASKLSLVLVLGSKNKVANFLYLHFSWYSLGCAIIFLATLINSSISSTDNSLISIKCFILVPP